MSSGQRGGYRRAQKPVPNEGPYRAFVGNLPQDTIQGDFDSLFNELQVQSVHMMRDRETDQFKGFAYVEFASRENLEKALLLDGADFDGHIVRVDVAEDKRGNKSGRGNYNNRDSGFGGNRYNSGHRNTFGSGNDTRKFAMVSEDGFQKVERNNFSHKRGNAVYNKEGNRPLYKSTMPLTSDPNRPKLNLAPRITDPVELERRRQKDEEDRKARLEKICSVKKN